MATTNSTHSLQPPEPLNFSKVEEWPKWRRRFERYRIATGLDKKSPAEQTNLLLYCMGDQAEDVLLALNLAAADRDTYDVVVGAFEGHFTVKRNVIYERAMFNKRVQQESESVEEFITALYTLSEHCEFRDLRNELIRDRIVVGIRDEKLSERMQLLSDLTLERAITMVKQSEQVKKQLPLMSGSKPKIEVDRVYTKFNQSKGTLPRHTNNGGRKINDGQNQQIRTNGNKICFRCGDGSHPVQQCPAQRALCRKCKKKGHYARVCKSSGNVHAVNKSDAFIGTITSSEGGKHLILVEIKNIKLKFKVDSGADVTCIPETMYRDNFCDVHLHKPTRRLFSANNDPLNVIGAFWEKIHFKGMNKLTEIYVVKGLSRALLDGDTCENLNIIKFAKIDSVVSDKMSFNPLSKFPKVFKGLGKVKIPYKIRLSEGAVPYALTVPRRIPIPLLKEIRDNLDHMIQLDVIEAVEEPTEWCSGMVLVPKSNGTMRMCVDYTRLNQYVKREVHPMPNTENVFGQLRKAKYYTKMDAIHGFWQCELDEASQLLTAFITPFGRFKYKRLPFGITAAPEFYQKRLSQILERLEGVIHNIDDVLVYGETLEEHDANLSKVLARLQEAGITLNPDKCVFAATRVKFLGHYISKNGIDIDDRRVDAMKSMESPKNVSEIRSLLGSINYLSRFIPNLSTKVQPLNELLNANNQFHWGEAQEQAFREIKDELTKAPTLSWFDPIRETVITSDASAYGVGAVLKQKQEDGRYRPIAYASKTLTKAQRSWAQIEKEGYALVWACDRFKDFVTGIPIMLETDHKPLVPLFTTKPLDEITPKLQRLRLRLLRYQFTIRHIPGKELGIADLLSRRPLDKSDDDEELEDEVIAYAHTVTTHLPASDRRLTEIVDAQQNDEVCQLLRRLSKDSWPEKAKLSSLLKEYWQYRFDITVEEGLLMKGSRIVIPAGLRRVILEKLHEGHQGITKCRAKAKESVWWPGLSTELETMIKQCQKCIQESTNRHEPLKPSEFPARPWQKVAIDLFKLEQKWYLLVTDFYSRYPEVAPLSDMTEASTITHLKSIFARHGIPEIVYSDNGTHFGPGFSSAFSKFAEDWGFRHIMSSPKFPQSNGFVEAGVKIIKRSFKKSDDGYLALMSYRSTPLSNGYTPAELLMGRKMRTLIPITPKLLNPKLPNAKELRKKEENRIEAQRKAYDGRHAVKTLTELQPGDEVWIVDMRRKGVIEKKDNAPRSYLVGTGKRTVRRNRFHLIPLNGKAEEDPTDIWFTEPPLIKEPPTIQHRVENRIDPSVDPSGVRPYVTQSGRTVKTPERLNL